jgi:hypothetical protein
MRSRISSSGLGTGSCRNNRASITPNMALFAPMPRASVATTTAVNPGLLRKLRAAKRTSLARASMTGNPRWSR